MGDIVVTAGLGLVGLAVLGFAVLATITLLTLALGAEVRKSDPLALRLWVAFVTVIFAIGLIAVTGLLVRHLLHL